MTSIERSLFPIGQEVPQGTKGTNGQGTASLSFSVLLDSLQVMLPPSGWSDRQGVQTVSNKDGQIGQPMQELPEEQEDMQAFLDAVLQAVSVLSPADISAAVKNNPAQWLQALASLEHRTGQGALAREAFSLLPPTLLPDIEVMDLDFSVPAQAQAKWQQIVQLIQSSGALQQSTADEMVPSSGQERGGQPVSSFLYLTSTGLIHKAAMNQGNADSYNQRDAGQTGATGLSSPLPVFTSSPSPRNVPLEVNDTISRVHQDHFIREMTDALLSRIRIHRFPGSTEAKISLYPDHLGQLDVRISIQQGQLVAQFIADNAAGRELLETHLSSLRTALQQQGIQVDRLDIFHPGEAAWAGPHDQQRDRSRDFQQDRQEKGKDRTRLDLPNPDDAYQERWLNADLLQNQPVVKNIDFSA